MYQVQGNLSLKKLKLTLQFKLILILLIISLMYSFCFNITFKSKYTDENVIYEETKKLLTDKEIYEKMSKASNPYGDGYTSKRIADILEKDLQEENYEQKGD